MRKQQFSIEIKAAREKIWQTLWADETFRDWANNIDEGMYLVGEIKEGNEVQFMSPSGYGVTSLVEKLVPNKFLLIRHLADTKDGGERDKEWTGGEESYSLAQNAGVTTLTVDIDVPPGQEETFQVRIPKALARVKFLAEKKG